MIFVLDNYDSFTYNLVQYLGELGAEVVVRRNDELSLAEIESLHPERIVISPGPCTPAEAGISVALVERLSGTLPLLGVCLGHQAIAHAFGGTVRRARTVMHGKTSVLRHPGTGLFDGLRDPLVVGRYHSLVVDAESFPAELEPTAFSVEDGEVMALRHRRHPTVGVQFHPESVLTPEGQHLLRNFLEGRLC